MEAEQLLEIIVDLAAQKSVSRASMRQSLKGLSDTEIMEIVKQEPIPDAEPEVSELAEIDATGPEPETE